MTEMSEAQRERLASIAHKSAQSDYELWAFDVGHEDKNFLEDNGYIEVLRGPGGMRGDGGLVMVNLTERGKKAVFS